MIFKTCFLFTNSFLKNGSHKIKQMEKKDERKKEDGRKGGKKEKRKKMKGVARSVINQLIAGYWLYSDRMMGGACCQHVTFPQCLRAMSRAVGRRKPLCCHLLMLQSKQWPQVLVLLASQL